MFTSSAGMFKTNTVAVLPLENDWIFDGLWGRAGVIFYTSDIFPHRLWTLSFKMNPQQPCYLFPSSRYFVGTDSLMELNI